MRIVRALAGALVTSLLIATPLWLLNLSSDSLGFQDLIGLVEKLAISYCFPVLVFYMVLERYQGRVVRFPGWLFVSTVGSILYAAGIVWTAMKLELKTEPSLGWVLVTEGMTFVGLSGILIFISSPLIRWLSPASLHEAQK